MAREIKPRGTRHSLDKLRFAIYIDILNGYNYTRVLEKLGRNGYEGEGYKDTKDMDLTRKEKLYKEALDMLKVDEKQIKDMRTLFYQRYEKLYENAMEVNDRSTALNCLNSITKFAGLLVDKVDVTTRSVIDIKFGFDDDNETSEE